MTQQQEMTVFRDYCKRRDDYYKSLEWIEHYGSGICPVQRNTMLHVEYNDGHGRYEEVNSNWDRNWKNVYKYKIIPYGEFMPRNSFEDAKWQK